jgi:ferredoxin--NADP+ reductase
MYRILEKRALTPDTVLMKIAAPRIAQSAQPGQFVIVRVDERGERIPLTVADYSPTEGWVVIVTQTVGVSTCKLNSREAGDTIADIVGPLGKPSDFIHESIEEVRKTKYLFVAGGVGAAPIYPQVKWLHQHGVEVDVIIGARTKELLILTEETKQVAGNLYIATDDGSAGYHGLVTGLMKELIEVEGKKYDRVVTIGPMIMMKFVAATTLQYGIPTIASLNSLMVDGTGMCGACRVSVGGEVFFTCVDGPEFDAHKVDYDEALRRGGMYRSYEERARQRAKENHICKIGLDK